MGYLKAPITVQAEATNECDNKCKHCYNYWRYLETGESVQDEGNRFLDVIDRVIEAEVFHVVVTGGEPLLKFDSVLEGMYRLREDNVFVTMNTNLSHLTPNRLQALRHAGLQGLLTSIYSSDENQHNEQMSNNGSFAATMRGIDMVAATGLPVGVNMVVDQSNVDIVYETGAYLRERGISRFHATRFCPAVQEQSEQTLSKKDVVSMLDQLLRLQEEGFEVGTLNPIPHCFADGAYKALTQSRACSAGLTSVGIGNMGDVRACQHTDIVSGNILERPLQEIWAEIPVWRREHLPEGCLDCSVIQECGGGCKNFAKIMRGDINGADPLFVKPVEEAPQALSQGEVPLDNEYVIDPHIKIRKEEEGGVLFKDALHYAIVDEFTYRLAPSLKGTFTAGTLAGLLDVDASRIANMIWFLENRGLVQQKEG